MRPTETAQVSLNSCRNGTGRTHQTILPFFRDSFEMLRPDCHTLLEVVWVVRAIAEELWHGDGGLVLIAVTRQVQFRVTIREYSLPDR